MIRGPSEGEVQMTHTATSATRIPALDVRPLSGHTGAEILGIDLTEQLDDAVVAQIRQALLQWKVVFFRNQNITQSQHIAFGRLFGDVTPGHPTMPAAFPDHPEVFLLDREGYSFDEAEGNAPSIEK